MRILQGLMDYHKDVVEYFNEKGVYVIFLLRRNLVRRMISVVANSYDRNAKLLNGTHKSHVHSTAEVCLTPTFLLNIFCNVCKLPSHTHTLIMECCRLRFSLNTSQQ